MDPGVRIGVCEDEGVPSQSTGVCKPELGTLLRLYFAVTEKAISSILL